MIRKRFPPGSDISSASVVTHSSGNHAQAVALAGKLCGIPAHIVMPEGSPAVKVAAVREYGGKITFCENNEQVYTYPVRLQLLLFNCWYVLGPCSIPFQSRIKTADEVLTSLGPGAVMIPSSNHADIMAGQGTIATELLEQVHTYTYTHIYNVHMYMYIHTHTHSV